MAKQQRGAATMERVLDAALDRFTARGVYDATIQDLAARADVSVGSIYHHFGSRERVAFALYCRCMESLLGAVTEAVRKHRAAGPGVRALVRSYLGWVEAQGDAARFIYAAGQTELLAKWKEEPWRFKREQGGGIVEWLQPHVEAGKVIAVGPALLEVMIIGPPAEFARRWLSGVPGLEMAEAVKVLPETVWRAVRSK